MQHGPRVAPTADRTLPISRSQLLLAASASVVNRGGCVSSTIAHTAGSVSQEALRSPILRLIFRRKRFAQSDPRRTHEAQKSHLRTFVPKRLVDMYLAARP